MIKYNDQSIIAGFIKELLHSFNLPTFKVYKEGDYVREGNFYLKGNKVRKLDKNGEPVDSFSYIYNFNKVIPNLVKNLEVRNNTYDSYTHKYLGDYLRFQRDYNHINLMSLYNCFSNEMPYDLYIEENNFIFDTEDNNYKIYMIPVKLFESYSLFIDCDSRVEMVCGFYGKTQYDPFKDGGDKLYNLYSTTYMATQGTSFNSPFIYDKLLKDNLSNIDIDTSLDNESELKLFIKIPFMNNSSIVILESTNSSNDWVFDKDKNIVYNKSVINFEYKDKDIPLISKSQLVEINSNINHPFADRLIEYLVDNAITPIDDISDNIKRVQYQLKNRRKEDGKIGIEYINKEGIWDNFYKYILYDISNVEGLLDTKCDLLGYIDKDVEQVLGKDPDIYDMKNKIKRKNKEGRIV